MRYDVCVCVCVSIYVVRRQRVNDFLQSPRSSTCMLSRKCHHGLPVLNFEALCCYGGLVNLSVARACS